MYVETHQLTTFLRKAVDEVKSEVARRRQGHAGTAPGGIVADTSVSIHEFTQQDRERVMELLLSDAQVVQLLYTPQNTEEQREASDDWGNEILAPKRGPPAPCDRFTVENGDVNLFFIFIFSFFYPNSQICDRFTVE